MLKKPSKQPLANSHSLIFTVAARSSPLSRRQVEEVFEEIKVFYPSIAFKNIWLSSKGDKDLSTSLRTMGRTNFFTKEIDDLQLSGGCRISVHSAKDLPEPVPKGLCIAALTKGVDSSDSLVLREGQTLSSLSQQTTIATSSLSREEKVKKLLPKFQSVDIRGTIQQRLEQLFSGSIDGVVIAQAALIRLNLTYLNTIKLPGETTPLQGRLAVLVRENDKEALSVFSKIDRDNRRE